MQLEETVYRPDMPDFGVYTMWPEPGDAWYHPDDAATIAELVPSNKVLMRTHYDGTHYHLRYGAKLMRVRPTMWLSVPAVDLEVGQAIEVLARHGLNDPGFAYVAEILYNTTHNKVEFIVRRGEMNEPRSFAREDLQPLQIKYQLRVGFYQHLPPECDPGYLTDWLNVGDLLE